MKQFLYLLTLFLFTGSVTCAQTGISGQVLSPDRKPLSATVRLKKSNRITGTDERGYFHLVLSFVSDTLMVSSVGFKPLILPVTGLQTQPLLLILKPGQIELGTVTVSTGYYTLPKERATGSFVQLDEKALNTSVSTDILSRLKGVTNGLYFDERVPSSTHLNIRGLSTIYGNTAPLVVLNNFPFDGDLNDINPNDVESITVLKDAAAASIWGVRAANGVIVITTKKGLLNKKPEVSFNANVTAGHKPDVFNIPMMSSADYIGVEKYLFSNGFYSTVETDPTHPPLSPVVELLIAQRDGKITQAQLNSQLDALSKQDVRNDFNKYLYQNSFNQQYAVSLNGGAEKSVYYYSLGYDHNTDNLDGKYGRLSLRADNTFTLGKLKLNPVLAYTRSETTAGRPAYNTIYPLSGQALYPYARLADAAGNPLPLTKDYRASFADSAEMKGLLNWQYVPLNDYQQRQTVTTINDLVAGLNADYALTRKLTAQVQYEYEWSANDLSDLYTADSYYVRNLVNSFTQADASGNLSFPVPKGGILNTGDNTLLSQDGRAQLKYNNTWGRNDLSALAGAEFRDIHQTGDYYTTYGYSKSGLTSIPVDYTDQYAQYSNSGNYLGIPYNTSFTDLTNRYTSYYANAAYTYDGRYTASGSARKDASNIFGVNANQRGIPLWSSGLAWNVSKERFYPAGWMDYLKLRITYGYNGNLPQNLTALATLVQLPGNYNNQPYGTILTYPNSNLQWEKVGVFNSGIDFGSRDNGLSGSIEYYHKNGSGLIGSQPIDPTVGIASGTVMRNVARMADNGIDLQVNKRITKGTLSWYAGLIFNYNADKITSYNSTTASGSAYINGGRGLAPVVGWPVNSVFSFPWAGLDHNTGDPIGYVNGQPSKDYAAIVNNTPLSGLKYNGPGLPPFFGNLTNTLSYKGFSLYTNIAYRFGYYFQKQTISYYNLYNGGFSNSDFAKRWQQPGDELHTYVPSMPTIAGNTYFRDFFYTNSSALVEKADNIRLQDINLSWQPDLSKWGRVPFKRLQVYVYGRNLGILWRANKSGTDPDFPTTYLPPSYSVSFGCKASF